MARRLTTLLLALLLSACALFTIGRGGEPLGPDSRSYKIALVDGDSLKVVNPVYMAPTPLHRALYENVAECTGRELYIPFDDLEWYVADSLKSDSGYLAYGISSYLNKPPMVVLERAFWTSPEVVTHESVHLIDRDPRENNWDMYHCVAYGDEDLPLRRWK